MDLRRRKLERAPRGDARMEGKALREGLRQGAVSSDRLRLLAYLGDPAARVALGGEAPATAREPLEWGQGLREWGSEVCVRIIASLAELLLPAWERQRRDDQAPRAALRAAEAWLDCPCPHHSEAARQAYRQANLSLNATPGATSGRFASVSAQNAARVAAFAARAAAQATHEDGNRAWFAGLAAMSASVAIDTHDLGTVQSAVRERLRAWVLTPVEV